MGPYRTIWENRLSKQDGVGRTGSAILEISPYSTVACKIGFCHEDRWKSSIRSIRIKIDCSAPRRLTTPCTPLWLPHSFAKPSPCRNPFYWDSSSHSLRWLCLLEASMPCLLAAATGAAAQIMEESLGINTDHFSVFFVVSLNSFN